MKSEFNANVDSFNDDVQNNDGYRYTTNTQISSRFANDRITDAILACADIRGKEILDVGCGDGVTTVHLFDRGSPALIHGLDPAASAIDCARKRVGDRAITVSVGSAYELPYPEDRFDLTVLRVVLHHMDRPADALREALRVSRRIVVVEPNGFNPIVKLLEKVSPYHRAHDEKSFTSWQLDGWVNNHGGVITHREWIGVVPMFFPNGCARFMKFWEPLVEKIPLLRQVACGQYVLVAERAGGKGKDAMAA